MPPAKLVKLLVVTENHLNFKNGAWIMFDPYVISDVLAKLGFSGRSLSSTGLSPAGEPASHDLFCLLCAACQGFKKPPPFCSGKSAPEPGADLLRT